MLNKAGKSALTIAQRSSSRCASMLEPHVDTDTKEAARREAGERKPLTVRKTLNKPMTTGKAARYAVANKDGRAR